MSSKREVLEQEFQGFKYSYGESIEALTGRFAKLLSEMEKAEIEVSNRTSNTKLLDVLKRIPDQANCSWFRNVNEIIVTTDCYCFKMKPDELISIIKSYNNADKQSAQGNTSDASIQIHDFTLIPNEVCLDDVCCTEKCRKKVKGFKEQAQSLSMQLQCTKSSSYEVKKKLDGYKEVVEAQKRDIRQLHSDLSEAKCRYLHFKELSEKLTVELNNLKSTFENTEFNFKKFDVSSEKVEKMINQQLKYSKKEVRNKGLGFVCIPPPYNHNYTSIPMTDEEIADLPEMEYGKPGDRKAEPVKPKKVKITRPDKTEIILEKQAFDKTFVKPAEVSNHTETLNFEKNANVDKHVQALDNTESSLSQNSPEVQQQEKESETKTFNCEFAMLNEFFEWSRKQTQSTAPSDSKCESPEATYSEKLESVESCESNCESSGAADSAKEDSAEPLQKECNSGGSAESTSETVTEPTTSEVEITRPVPDIKCVNVTDASTSCADKVIIEDWVERDDVVCQKADDVCPKTSNLSADAPPYVRKDVFKPALRGPSNKYVPPKQTVRNENANLKSECANCCRQGHKKQGRKVEKFANKSSNKSYNSYSASVGWNGSGYAPYVKKQTCYNCGIPGHIARNCTHRPYVPYYAQHQRVTLRDRSYSKPMKDEKPKAMMNKSPKVKPSDGDWNAAKAKRKQALKPKQVLKNKKVEKQNVLPKAPKKLDKPKQVWRAKHKAATSPVLESKGGMCFREVSYVDASGIPRTTMAWVPMSC
ncbi:putative transcription factor interactor and regulator CCHC(Zn) family [Helianthus debilis subsp. tardiflorus]